MNWFSPGTHPSLVPRPWECFGRTAITVTPVPSALYPSRAREACNQITTFGPIIIFRPPAKTSAHWHHWGHYPCHVIWHVLVFISCGLLRFLNTMAQSFLAPQVLHFLVVFCQTLGPWPPRAIRQKLRRWMLLRKQEHKRKHGTCAQKDPRTSNA